VKVLVAVKQVKVLGDELEFAADGRDVDPDFLDRALNEWDACAVEEALQLRERLGEGEVVAVTVGDAGAEAGLRRALAMGADRAARVEAEPFDPVSTARALAGVVRSEAPELVLCGVQSADSVQGSTGVALAELLDLPRVAVVTKLDWDGVGPARVDRELEGGLIDEVEVDTPAVLTIQTGINAPRYANLRAIKQAEQQEIPVVAAGELGEPSYRVRRMFAPPRGEGAELLEGSPEAVAEQILAIVKERLA
jgi:electron transfer flavoprotein beta subunit